MALEIELKVWVKDPVKLSAQLDKLGVFLGAYYKNDIYFSHPQILAAEGKNSLFRLRTQDKSAIVTHKEKKIENGIETSVETEFSVDPSNSFLKYIYKLGFVEDLKKTKVGKAWDLGTIKAELSEVVPLGYFLELETLLPENSEEKDKDLARDSLLALLSKLEISQDQIEPLPYSKLLSDYQ